MMYTKNAVFCDDINIVCVSEQLNSISDRRRVL